MTEQTEQPAASRFNPRLLILLMLPIMGVIGAFITLLANNPSASTVPPPLPTQLASRLIDRTAPNFELAALDNSGSVRLSSLRGRVVFVNFWATWCEPCRRELPAFQTFTQQQADNGPVILAVNTGETAEQIQPFLDENGVSGVTVLLDSDLAVQDLYTVNLFPSTFVIDASGVVRELHLGELKLDELNAYVEQYSAS
jgi:peroxiredoxin